nr:MAG TPA: hypothetical protein [Caudoviricetes sp.]
MIFRYFSITSSSNCFLKKLKDNFSFQEKIQEK